MASKRAGSPRPVPAAKRSRTDEHKMQQAGMYADALFSLYSRGFAFPEWSVAALKSGELDEMLKQVTCYRVYGVQESTADTLLREREPVNIAQHEDGKPYNETGLLSSFGIETSGYNRLWNNDPTKEKLPGAISVYCPTLIDVAPGHKVKVHVMNMVGLAFDSDLQPDAQFFAPILYGEPNPSIMRMDDIGWRRMEALWNYFITMWDMAYFAANDKGLKAVCVARIGGSAFGGCLPDIALDSATILPHKSINYHYHRCLGEGKEYDNFYDFLYQETLRLVAEAGRYAHIQTVHCTNETQPAHANLLVPEFVTSHPGMAGWNRVPDCFRIITELEATGTRLHSNLHLHECLWLNAWDPHSVVGNGNMNDSSLDGYYGRSSSLGLMCFPLTNPWITHKALPPTSEYMRNNAKIFVNVPKIL